ncbi:precorrin-2 dehydrogenase/sirohydrochlorin ferrochelatase family protein [Sphingomonas nostoxanthinifaciens]|uniref:precorrin-2 dehydrogenase/sirohydrochlorin ferrochelatase family protein n=1 Tax=Sphingomonas nostoxanthinifaciens TaxID=2872652 RepID=UPI001CC1ECC5|nr:siroheme synthase [Sphingomonas nostoxanthinifaciens]UAK23585.1 siroheme synthase [Sphingomonas nostoxanthinifaciens]
MADLPIFVRLAGRPVILIGQGPAAEAKRRLIERAGGVAVGEDAQAALAIVVDDDAAVARLKARGILVNAVDRVALCDFTLPAIVDRAPVLVAIGTGGVSAGLAAALRQRLETILPPGLGRLAEALHAARAALRARYPDAGARRQAIGALLGEGGALDALAEHATPAVALDFAPVDRIERIAIASPDPDDLTLRAARLLGQADRIFHDPLISSRILDRARADAERIAGPAPALAPPGLNLDLLWKPR